jgi:hypothetical protein
MMGEVRLISSICRRFLIDRAQKWMFGIIALAPHPDYRAVRLAAGNLWQPLFSASRGDDFTLPPWHSPGTQFTLRRTRQPPLKTNEIMRDQAKFLLRCT